jgi:hypothetical protein
MNMTRIALAGGAVLALAACGGAGTGGTAPGTPAASTPAVSASPVASLDTGKAGEVCAALNALLFAGHTGADAIATAAQAYGITQAQVVYAIDHRCPELRRIVPAGD